MLCLYVLVEHIQNTKGVGGRASALGAAHTPITGGSPIFIIHRKCSHARGAHWQFHVQLQRRGNQKRLRTMTSRLLGRRKLSVRLNHLHISRGITR